MASGLTGGGLGPITGPPVLSGNGTPEGLVKAIPGALYRRLDSTPAVTYIKEEGVDKTGWSPIASGSGTGAVPTGTILDFAGSTAPNGYLLCFGQLVSRTDYADLFGVIGSTYGVGDGTSTFGIPDLRGTVIAGFDNMGGTYRRCLTLEFSCKVYNDVWIEFTTGNTNWIAGQWTWITGTYIPADTWVDYVDPSSIIWVAANQALGGTVSGAASTLTFHNYDPVTFQGGYPVHRIIKAEMPSHYHTYSAGYVTAAGIAAGSNYNNTNLNTGAAGSDKVHNNMQPTYLMNKMIKT